MNESLPDLQKRNIKQVKAFVHEVFHNSLIQLTEQPNKTYRIVFNVDYFGLSEGVTEASKSQWNTLKKKMKRRDHNIFILRNYGAIECPEPDKEADKQCLYLDFGYFAN